LGDVQMVARHSSSQCEGNMEVNAFLEAYPWIVLSLGLIGAATALLASLIMASVVLLQWDRSGWWPFRIIGAAAFVAFGNTSAIVVLAFTKWMLAVCS